MNFNRREALAVGAGAVATFSFMGSTANAAVDEEIAAFTGGAEATDGGIELTAPEIAENGTTVPIGVAAAGATVIRVWATGNPTPGVATFTFGELSPNRSASTRIRLAKSQDVVAIAQMEDGSFRKASAAVKVTIGGCGG